MSAEHDDPSPGLTAAQLGLMSCESCQLLVAAHRASRRPRTARAAANTWSSAGRDRSRRPGRSSSRRAICYFPAMLLPVLNTTTLGSSEADTILSGIAFLYTSGSWPLALIVLVASVMIPLGKLAALAYLLLTVQRGSITNNHDRTRLYRLVEFIGRWSMLDVFVDTFTVALVQLSPLMSVAPGTGRAVLRRRGGADDVRGRNLRPPSDLGLGRHSIRLPMADEPPSTRSRRRSSCASGACASRSSGSSRSLRRWSPSASPSSAC